MRRALFARKDAGIYTTAIKNLFRIKDGEKVEVAECVPNNINIRSHFV